MFCAVLLIKYIKLCTPQIWHDILQVENYNKLIYILLKKKVKCDECKIELFGQYSKFL